LFKFIVRVFIIITRQQIPFDHLLFSVRNLQLTNIHGFPSCCDLPTGRGTPMSVSKLRCFPAFQHPRTPTTALTHQGGLPLLPFVTFALSHHHFLAAFAQIICFSPLVSNHSWIGVTRVVAVSVYLPLYPTAACSWTWLGELLLLTTKICSIPFNSLTLEPFYFILFGILV
jgi:hypothetical protein